MCIKSNQPVVSVGQTLVLDEEKMTSQESSLGGDMRRNCSPDNGRIIELLSLFYHKKFSCVSFHPLAEKTFLLLFAKNSYEYYYLSPLKENFKQEKGFLQRDIFLRTNFFLIETDPKAEPCMLCSAFLYLTMHICIQVFRFILTWVYI